MESTFIYFIINIIIILLLLINFCKQLSLSLYYIIYTCCKTDGQDGLLKSQFYWRNFPLSNLFSLVIILQTWLMSTHPIALNTRQLPKWLPVQKNLSPTFFHLQWQPQWQQFGMLFVGMHQSGYGSRLHFIDLDCNDVLAIYNIIILL